MTKPEWLQIGYMDEDGFALVGEPGPELVDLPKGSLVRTDDDPST